MQVEKSGFIKTQSTTSIGTSLFVLAALTSPALHAQTAPEPQATDVQEIGLGEIVVTAQKRAENLQSVPAAISAITADALQARGITNTSDLMGSLPNLQVTSAYGTTQPNFSLRGISVANEFSAATASPVGVYVDEVYQSFRASHGVQLYDLERVEVLRGPQGTLYGRNTTGGAVNLITRKPRLQGTNGYVTAGFARFNTVSVTGAAEFTLVEDKFGVRVAGTRAYGDGYTFNPTLNEDFSSTDSIAGRITFRFAPTDTLDLTLKVFGAQNDPRQDIPYGIGYLQGRSDAGGYSRFAPRPELGGRTLNEDEVQADQAGEYFTNSVGFSFNASLELGALTLTSITGFDRSKYRLSPFDCDGSPNNVCAIRYFSDSKNFNQELRFTYDSDRLKLIGGLYYGKDTVETVNEPDFFGFLRPLLLGAGLPGNFGNIPIAIGNSLRTLPAFALNPALNPALPSSCAPVVVNPNGFFDARSLIAFNADVALLNRAGPGPVQTACAQAGAPPFGPILANQRFTIARPSAAIFGEAKYNFTDKLSATIGLRFTRDEVVIRDARTILFALDGTTPIASLVPFSTSNVSLNGPTVRSEEKTNRLTGRFILDYQFTDTILGYASYSRGFRTGSFNALAYQDISQVYFVPPEEVDAFEVGLKTRLFNNRIQLNLAGFYYDYKGQQIAQVVGATSFLRSANGRVFGAEAELVAQITDRLRFDAGIGLLDTKYKGNQVAGPNDPPSPQLTLNINGNQFPNAPKFTATAGFDFTAFESDTQALRLRGEMQYTGRYFFDPFGDYGQNDCRTAAPFATLQATPELACGNPGYFLFNGRITYEIDKFAISVFGKNLTDKFYYTYGLNLNAFFQDYLVRGAPRTFGVEGTFRF